MVRPLALRQEKYRAEERKMADEFPIAGVMVDTGIFHLDYLHDYKIPAELSSQILSGSRVQVSFNGIRREGIVYVRREKPERAGRLLSIEKVLGPHLIDSTMIDLVTAVSKRWACHPFDIWRSVLPSRIISAEKRVLGVSPSQARSTSKVATAIRSYYFLPPFQDEVSEISAKVGTLLKDGNVLLLMPDEKNVEDFIAHSKITNIVNISSNIVKSERYFSFLTMNSARNTLYIGSRSAIFAPIPHLAGIVIHREISENYYEVRSPGWNVRDVALIRSEVEGVKVLFTGYGPSSEMGRLISNKYVAFFSTKEKLALVAEEAHFGELLPSKILKSMRKALTKGSILVLVPRKGYASGVVCTSCRNVAHHSCGGVVSRFSLKSDFVCTSCSEIISVIACHWCKSRSFSIIGRGSARISEEIGRALPGHILIESNAEKMVVRTEGAGKIVVATPGAQPRHPEGFSGVYLLDAERFLSGINVRSIERSEEAFFSTLSRSSSDAELAITLKESHPVVATLVSWNPKLLLLRSLREREDAHLPPYVRTIALEVPAREVSQFENGVRKAIAEGRLPGDIRIRRIGERVWIDIDHRSASLATEFVHEFLRKRSASGKKLYSVRIDPYDFG